MDGYDYFVLKKTDRIYLSKAIETTLYPQPSLGEKVTPIKRPFRIVSKVLNSDEAHIFITEGKELILRITEGGKQEIIIKFYEDTRNIRTVQIQKYNTMDGKPHPYSFSFTGEEINKLYNFIRNIPLLPITSPDKSTFTDEYINEIVLTKEHFLQVFSKHPEIVEEIIKNNIDKAEIIALARKKEQIKKFEYLLNDADYFNNEKVRLNKPGDEAVWQTFFEDNSWILGYGVNFIFNSPLEGEKLEQIVKGNDVFSSGKRVDMLLKSKGIISSLCFGEIKTHKTPLLKSVNDAYRPESWAASNELCGGIAQIQKSVQKSIENIKTKTQIKDNVGDLTGEELFLYLPKSFLIIGTLGEFKSNNGINEEKFSSFELLRRNMINPEIITFDELFERTKYLLNC
jgi:hypothetical protein